VKTSGGSWGAAEHDGAVGAAAEPRVHALDDGLDRQAKLLVAVDLHAARRGELHEREASTQLGLALEQALDGLQPLLDALRVVEPIDADAQQRRLGQAEGAKHRRTALRRRRQLCQPVHGLFDRDGIRPDQRAAAAAHDAEVFAIDPRLDEGIDRIDEVVAVLLRVEAEDARASRPSISSAADAMRYARRWATGCAKRDDGRRRQPVADLCGASAKW
jgi:hypothetical protein